MREKENSLVRRIVIFSAFLLVAVFSLHQIVCFDVWFHLKTGEDICRHWSVPHYDPFSFTASDHPYIDSHWLFQVILFGVFHLFGLNGLIIFKTLFFLFVFWILFRIGYHRSCYLISVIFLVLCLFNIRNRFFERPEMITFLLVASFLYILQRFKQSQGRSLYALPLLQVIWVNSHGLFVLGPILMGIYCMGDVLSRWIRLPFVANRNNESCLSFDAFFVLCGVFLACVLACLANPYGLAGIVYALRLSAEIGSKASFFMKQVGELKSPLVLNSLDLFSYKALVGMGVMTFLINFRRIRWECLLLFAVFFYLSLLAQRNIALFALVSMPIMVLNVREALEAAHFSIEGRLRFLRRAAEIVLLGCMAMLIFSIVTNIFYVHQRDLRRFGLGVSRLTYPEDAVRFLRENNIQGRMFNDANFGGYLIWHLTPERKVFVDGRWEVYGDTFLADYLRSLKDLNLFDRLVRRYDIGYVLLSSQNALSRLLAGEKNWSLVYLDPLSAIFVKNSPEYETLIAKYKIDFNHYLPLIAESRMFPEEEDYAVTSLTRRSELAFLWVNKANFMAAIGRPDLAERCYYYALSSSLYLPEIYHALGRLSFNKGDFKEAEDRFQRVIRINPDYPLVYYRLGMAYAASGKREEAIKAFKQAVRRFSRLADAYGMLGTLYGQKGLYFLAEKSFWKAVKLAPQARAYYQGLGDAYFYQGKYQNAVEVYEKLLPGHPDIYFKLGVIFYQTGQYRQAAEFLKRYKKHYPNDPEADLYLKKMSSQNF